MSWTRKIALRSALLLAALTTVVGFALPTAGPASAASLPKIQTYEFGTWNSGWRVRPGGIVFGSYFLVKNLRYRYYTGTRAYAHDRLLVDNCRPSCAQAGYWASGTAYFWGAFYHRGPGRNFGYLRLRWGRHLQHSMLLWINSRGQWTWR
jgi:hypothetical protein